MASRERRWSRRGFIGTTAGAAVGAASGWAPRVFAEGSQDALAKPALALGELKAVGPARRGVLVEGPQPVQHRRRHDLHEQRHRRAGAARRHRGQRARLPRDRRGPIEQLPPRRSRQGARADRRVRRREPRRNRRHPQHDRRDEHLHARPRLEGRRRGRVRDARARRRHRRLHDADQADRHQGEPGPDSGAAGERRSAGRPLREGDHAAHEGADGQPHHLRDRPGHAGEGADRAGAPQGAADFGRRRTSARDAAARHEEPRTSTTTRRPARSG